MDALSGASGIPSPPNTGSIFKQLKACTDQQKEVYKAIKKLQNKSDSLSVEQKGVLQTQFHQLTDQWLQLSERLPRNLKESEQRKFQKITEKFSENQRKIQKIGRSHLKAEAALHSSSSSTTRAAAASSSSAAAPTSRLMAMENASSLLRHPLNNWSLENLPQYQKYSKERSHDLVSVMSHGSVNRQPLPASLRELSASDRKADLEGDAEVISVPHQFRRDFPTAQDLRLNGRSFNTGDQIDGYHFYKALAALVQERNAFSIANLLTQGCIADISLGEIHNLYHQHGFDGGQLTPMTYSVDMQANGGLQITLKMAYKATPPMDLPDTAKDPGCVLHKRVITIPDEDIRSGDFQHMVVVDNISGFMSRKEALEQTANF